MADCDVFVYPVSKKSKYVPLTFVGVENRYLCLLGEDGDIDKALAKQRQFQQTILHVQWEEFLIGKYKNNADADAAVDHYKSILRDYVRSGGRVVLTIHNGLPHEVPFHSAFLQARQATADVASAVLVHNSASMAFLENQIRIDASKIRIFPHPSYLGTYESEYLAHSESDRSAGDGGLLCFGTMRAQKNISWVIDALSEKFLSDNKTHLQVSGDGRFGQVLKQHYQQRSDIIWDLRYIPDDEAVSMIRKSTCAILSYDTFLTSGVAHLIISAGGLYVAPAVSQHIELLPAVNHRFLYRPGDAEDARRAVRDVLALTGSQRLEATAANLDVAKALRPQLAGLRLAAIYDEVLGKRAEL